MSTGDDTTSNTTGDAGVSAPGSTARTSAADAAMRSSAMQLDEHVEFPTLGWVKPQIDQLLSETRQALEGYTEDPGDASAMQSCMELLHQVLGTLRMVELYGAVELVREMEHLAHDLRSENISNRDEAAGALMRALVQLPDYLDLVESGQQEIPVVLLPLIRDLRGARDAEPVDERVLFHPDIDQSLPADADGSRAAFPFADLRQRIIPIRSRFQVQLLAWTQGHEPEFGEMRGCMDELRSICHVESARRLWWIAAGVLDALQEGRLDQYAVSIRQQCGQLDRTIRKMQNQGEDVCNDDDARNLARMLLFAIARAEPGDGRAEIIAQTFALGQMAPSARQLEHARATMSGRNRTLLETVAKAIREDLLRVKEGLDIFLRRGCQDSGELAPQLETLRELTDTLATLDLEIPARMVAEQRRIIAEIVDGEREARPDTVLDVACALLHVDASLDEVDPGDSTGAGGTSLFSGEARKIMRALMREAGANLAKVKRALTAFIESSWSHEQLVGAPKTLGDMSGALRILNLDRPAGLVDGIARYIENELIVDRRVPTVEEMDHLADAIAGVEYYLEIGRDANASNERILDEAQHGLGALDYWPIPERRVPAETWIASAEADVTPASAAHEPPPADSASAPGAGSEQPDASEHESAVVPGVGPGEWVETEEEVLEPVSSGDAPVDTTFQDAVGIDTDIRDVFVEEVGEEIGHINAVMPVWKANPEDMDALRNVRRSFHTLKGSGRLVGAVALGEFSWRLENMLNRVLDGTIAADADVREVLDAAVATLPQLHAGLQGEPVWLDPPLDAIMQSADKLAAGEPARIADFVHGYRKVVRKVRRWVAGSPGAAAAQTPQAPEATAEARQSPSPAPEVAAQQAPPATTGSISLLTDPGLPVIDPVLQDVLRTEVDQHLECLNGYLARNRDHDAAVDDELVRAAHTLHGAIAMVGIDSLAAMLAPMEVWLRRVRSADAPLDREGCSAISDAAAMTEHLMAQFDVPVPDVPDPTALTERMEALRDRWPESEPASARHISAGQPEPGYQVPEAEDLQPFAAEQERLAAEQAERERLAVDQAEQERLAAEQAEQERLAAEQAEQERLAAEQAEQERLAAEQAEQERLAAEQAEQERLAAEQQAERERLEAERAAQDRMAAVQAEPTAAKQQDFEREFVASLQFPPFPDDPQPDGPIDLERIDPEIAALFAEEGSELLDASDDLVATLRSSPDDLDSVRGLQRSLHTLKGGAHVAGITAVGDLAHAMETLLESISNRRGVLEPVEVDSLERGFDRLHDLVERVEHRRAIATPTHAIAWFNALAAGKPVAYETIPDAAPSIPEERPEPVLLVEEEARAPSEWVRVRPELLDSLVNAAGEASIYRARLDQQIGGYRGNLVELDQIVARLRDQFRKLEIETETQILSRYQRETEGGPGMTFDPLELDRFSNLQQYSRALAESVSDLASIQDILDDQSRQSETLLLQQSRVNSDLQDGLMRTRMVPFASLVPGLRRTLRGVADELGKRAQLRVEGAQGEMDRSVLERMKASFGHMLRNAITHGIEDPARRSAAGKPAEGTVTIEVGRQGTEVLIRVSDDGAGFDRDAIRAKAIARGLIKPDAPVSDSELYALVEQTGFSTAEEVSQLAGRGVGMDVVANEIRQLGGSLKIESERGRGACFDIRLPFTLAVTQAITVHAGGTRFYVPKNSLQAISRIGGAVMTSLTAGAEVNIDYLGEEYQLFDLAQLLGLGPAHAPAETSGQVPVLLVRAGDLRAAIHIDALIGSDEIVVKPVGPQVGNMPGMFGATILGDGSVMLILDPAPLVRHFVANRAAAALASTETPETAAAPDEPVAATVTERRGPRLVMVVDDSITMRKVTTRVLEREQMVVITAKDGVDALNQLQGRIPDVMLLDIEMPRMDGYELATHMKNDVRFRHVPIIMITSRTGEKHRQRAFDIGVDRYLGKPYGEASLLRNIAEVLEEMHG